MDLSFYTQEVAPAMLRGLWVSIGLILPSAVFGLAIGVLAGTLRVYGRPFWKRLSEMYGLLFRGFPLLVQLYLWYFGLPQLGIYLSPFAASVLGFSLCSGAYHAEVRPRGAALDQAGPAAGRPIAGFQPGPGRLFHPAAPGHPPGIAGLRQRAHLPDQVLLSRLHGDVHRADGRSQDPGVDVFKYLEVFFVVGAIYLALVSLASWGLNRLERYVSIPGFECARR